MSRMITRTFKTNVVTILNASTKEQISSYKVDGKITRKQVMKQYIKETDDKNIVGVFVEISEVEEQREISLANFMKYSTVVEKKEPTAKEKEETLVDEITKEVIEVIA